MIAPVKKEKKPKAAVTAAQEGEGIVAAVTAGAASAAAAVGTAVNAVKEAVVGGAEEVKKDGKKKEKKEKPAKAAPAKAAEPAKITPGLIQLIVGKITEGEEPQEGSELTAVKAHPDADSLYVEQIDCGEAEPRTICSGLRAYCQLEDLQDKLVVVVAK